MKLNRDDIIATYEKKDWLTAKQKFEQDDHGVELLRLLQDDGHISEDIDWLSAQDQVDYGYWLHNEKSIPYEELARREVEKYKKDGPCIYSKIDGSILRQYDPTKTIDI